MAFSDDIAGAPDITPGGGGWDNLTATDNTDEPHNVDFSHNNVWQKVYLTAPGTYVFSHDTVPAGDTVMTIWQGPPSSSYGDLVIVGADDDSAGNSKPQISYTSPGGEWIYIESTGYGGARVSGQATLISGLTAPAPDFSASTYWTAYFGGGTVYVSDVGVYVGPWPPAPPIPAAFALEVAPTVVAYLACLPNAGAPAEPADGSYSTAYYLAARFSGFPSDTDHAWDTGLSPGVGAHLFVLTDAAPPTVAGVAVVPPLYVVGATGPPVPDPAGGAWSAWQPTRDQPVPTTGTAWLASSAETHTLVPSDVDTVTELAAEQPDVADGVGPLPASAAPFLGTNLTSVAGHAQKASGPFSSWSIEYAEMEIGFQPVAPTHSWFPTAMTLKVEGLDYTIIPGKLPTDQDEWVNYEGPVVFDHWTDLPIKISVEPTSTATGTASLLTPPDVIQRVAWDTARTFTSSDWPAYGTGSLLLSRTAPGSTGLTILTDTVPLSGVPEDFVLLIQPDTSVVPPSEALTVPSDDSNNGYNVRLDCYFGPSDWDGNHAHTAYLVAVAHYTDARWRYWDITATAEPKWHTVGGHWATVGPAGLKILTPGRGPVDVVDGPA